MNRLSSYFGTVVAIIVLVVLASVLFGVFFSRPVFISYVLSNSMEPTLSAGDVIFISPIVLSPSVGDIMVFKSGESYLVHRIVGITNEGFLTKGDNNIATDQLNGKPYVKPGDIIGGVVLLGSRPIAIPHGGEYIKGIATVLGKNKVYVIALLLIVGLFLTVDRDAKKRGRRDRAALKVSFPVIYSIFSLFMLVIISLSMVMVTEERYIDYSITNAIGSKNPDWLPPGTVFQRSLDIDNYGRYPYYYRLEVMGQRASTEDSMLFLLQPGEKKSVLFTIHAPMKTALYAERLKVWKYLPLLPAQAVETLSSIHPYLPVLAVDVVLMGALVVIFFIIGGQNESPIRVKSRLFRRLKIEVVSRLNI